MTKTPSEKIQKVLARSGFGSRRQIEQWLSAGRISVNGKLAKLGDRIIGNEKISLDGKIIEITSAQQTATRLLIYYKPEGEICTRTDPENRPTVFTHLPKLLQGRWISIGRLDLNTSGLLLFTNDGELANRLMHPRYEIEREYLVRVFGEVRDEMIDNLLHGVHLEDGVANFKSIQSRESSGLNRWFNVVLCEGKNREVRRLWESQGIQVSRLMRIRFANIKLPRDLSRGKYREVTAAKIEELLEFFE